MKSIEDAIESQAREVIKNSKNPESVEKQESILEKLREIKVGFQNKISQKISQTLESVAAPFRDNRISREASKFSEKIKNNSDFKKEDFVSLKKDLEPLLKTLGSGEWGRSKNKIRALEDADTLLRQVNTKALAFNDLDLSLRILSVYEKNDIEREYNNQLCTSEVIREIVKHQNSQANYEIKAEDIGDVFKNNPYLILKYLQENSYKYKRHEENAIVEKQIDVLIEKYPDGANFTWETRSYFKHVIKQNPEKYALDPKNRKVVFDTLTRPSSYSSGDRLSGVYDRVEFFKKELGSISEEEKTEYINNIRGESYFRGDDSQSILSFMDLSEKDFKDIHKKVFHTYTDEKKYKFSKEELVTLLTDTEKSYYNFSIPLVNHKYLGLDVATRVELFNKTVKSTREKSKFLSQAFSDFNEIFEGIPEQEYDSSLKELISLSVRADIVDFRSIWVLLPEYDIPKKYKDEVVKTFAGGYAASRDNGLFKKFFGDSGGERPVFSENEEWLRSDSEIFSELEKTFYADGARNDVRHFFYEVLDNKREAVDKDLLIRQYAKNGDALQAEEFIELFYIQKKIPESYAELFLPRMGESSAGPFVETLSGKKHLGQISEEQYSQILTSGMEHGEKYFANTIFSYCISNNVIPQGERADVFKKFTKNISKQRYGRLGGTLGGFMGEYLRDQNLSDSEKQVILKDIFENLLARGSHRLILDLSGYVSGVLFDAAFVSDNEKKEFAQAVFDSEDPETNQFLQNRYLSSGRPNKEDKPQTICDLLNDKKFNEIFERGLKMDNLAIYTAGIGSFSDLSENQQQKLIEVLLNKEDLFNKDDNHSDVKVFCSFLMNGAVKNEEYRNQILSKIFSSQYVTSEALLKMGESSFFPSSDSETFKEYIELLLQKCTPYEYNDILQRYTAGEKPIFSPDQIKDLSTKIIKHSGLDESAYKMYLSSTSDFPKFYLDQKLFDEGVDRLIKANPSDGSKKLLSILKIQRLEHGNPSRFVLTKKQEEGFSENIILDTYAYSSTLDELYAFDVGLFEQSLESCIEKNKFNTYHVTSLFSKVKPEMLENVAPKFIDHCLEVKANINSREVLGTLCDSFASKPELLARIKKNIEKMPSGEQWSLRTILLSKDLLEPIELANSFDQMRSQENVRSQVLMSAEILGSLVSVASPDKLEKLIGNQNEIVKTKVKEITSFVQKYPLEKKGRTVATMLFAKEYLPERSMEDIVERVAMSLSKYERVLEQYNYNAIPEGLGVSLGCELEITRSTADGYKKLTGSSLKEDIVRLSRAAHIGSGADAVHEVATRPTTNPYLLLLEMQLLQDLEYIDLNFDRSEEYAQGSHSFHLTVGGESGLKVNDSMHFLQNSIITAGWGGLLAGAQGKRVSGGRGVTLRGRDPNGTNNVQVFDKATSSVEMRSISPDKMEPTQRAVLTSYHGGAAIQALEKFTNLSSDRLSGVFVKNNFTNETELFKELEDKKYLKGEVDQKSQKIIFAWGRLLKDMDDAVEYHNTNFLMGETIGHLDKDGVWIEREEFKGEDNLKMFTGVVKTIDPTLSVEEYVGSTKIDYRTLFSSVNTDFSDKITKINNLFLKPDVRKERKDGEKENGDKTNALSMYENTMLGNSQPEYRDEDAYLKGTVFQTLGERREGYYNAQGASERMITHATQIALLKFNKKLEELLRA